MRRPWGLRVRVLIAAALIAAVSLVTFGVLLKGLLDARTAAMRSRRTSDALVAASRLQRLALDLETGVRGFVLTGEQDFLAPYEQARRKLSAAGARLAGIDPDPDQAALVGRLRAELYAYSAGYLAGVVRQVREGAPAARSVATAREGKARFDAITADLDRYTASELREQARRRALAARLRNRSIATAAAGLAVLIALIALVALGAVRAIVGPVRRLQGFARELGAGRLSVRLPERGPPELAELARAFNLSAESLSRLSERHLAELDAVFSEAPLGLAFFDRELRMLRVNDALAEMKGRSAGELLGRIVGEVMLSREIVQRVLETGAPELDHEVRMGGRVLVASYFPVRGEDGQLLAVGTAVTDVTARRRAESARERLQAATAALAAAATVEEVVAATVEEAGHALDTASAALLVLDRGEDVLRAPWGTVPLREETPATAAVRSGEAIFLADQAALPLVASGRVLGVLTIAFRRPPAFDADERALLHALASQSAVALARAQLFERERSVAQTLQASLLPRALPAIEGLDLAGRLEAGAAGVEVGGDFYDAFAIAEGVWGIAVGDVCGKGVDAAALTALARHTARAAAHEQRRPSAVLEALNRAVLAESRPGQFLTAVFARLTALPGGGFRLAIACGGHPPPVLLDAGGATRPIDCSGTLLGVIEDPEVVDAELELAPGDTLLLYTDGLTEASAPARTLTTEEVAELLAAVRGETAEQTAEGCLRSALEAGGGVTRDDIAVLVAQVGLATVANASPVASTAGRTPAGESSTRGQ